MFRKTIFIFLLTIVPALFAQNIRWELKGGFNSADVTCFNFQANFILAGTRGGTIAISTNDGARWQLLAQFQSEITGIIRTTSGLFFAGTTENGLQVSSDNGITWAQVNSLNTSSVRIVMLLRSGNILIGSNNSGVFIGDSSGTLWQNTEPGPVPVMGVIQLSNQKIIVASPQKIYISNNGGSSFNLLNASLANISGLAEGIEGTILTNSSGLTYSSSDTGRTWSPIPGTWGMGLTSTLKRGNNQLLMGFSKAGFAIAVNSINTFARIVTNTRDSLINCISINPFNGKTYAGGRFGIYSSLDTGKTWISECNGLNFPKISSVNSRPYQNFVYAYSRGRLYKSINSGNTFSDVTSFPKIHPDSSETAPNNIFCIGENIVMVTVINKLYRSVDTGTTWELINLNEENSFGNIIETSPGNFLMASYSWDKFYKSSDAGRTWIVKEIGSSSRRFIKFGRGNIDRMYATDSTRFFISTDYGEVWSWEGVGLPVGAPIFCFSEFDWREPLVATLGGIYTSHTLGISWIYGLPYPLNSFNPRALIGNWNSMVFTGSKYGVFGYKLIPSRVFSWYNDNLLCKDVYSLSAATSGTIFCGTAAGLYATSATIGVQEELKQKTNTLSADVFPNPAKNEITIQYTLSDRGTALLAIYSILGEKVADILNEDKSPGNYSFEWKCNSLPSGSYFIILRSGSKTVVKKIQLVK